MGLSSSSEPKYSSTSFACHPHLPRTRNAEQGFLGKKLMFLPYKKPYSSVKTPVCSRAAQ